MSPSPACGRGRGRGAVMTGSFVISARLDTRIARILFALEGNIMVLLHGFIKKQQKTPKPELDLAKERLKQLRRRT